MAENNDLPQVFTRKLKNGAPWVSIAVCGLSWVIIVLIFGTNLDRLLLLDILLYGTSLILEFVALVALRLREPNLPRPFVVPGGLVGAVLAGVGPTAMLLIAFLKNRDEHLGSFSTLILSLLFMLAGVLLYFVVVWTTKKKVLTTSQP
jgi:amino acid transporter